MILRYTIFLLATLSLSISAGEYSRYIDQIDNVVTMANVDMKFTGAVLIADKDEIYYQQAFGYANENKQTKLTDKHQFSTGSISKEFTTIALMMLVEQDKIQYADNIAQYLPTLPSWASTITIEQLLSHTSGLPPIKWQHNINSPMVIEQLMHVTSLNFPPGEGYQYGNLNVILRALIIEKITAQSFSAFMQTHLFAPAGMKNTHNRLNVEDKNPSVLVEEYNSAILGVSFYSTPFDLYQWQKALWSYKFVSRQAMNKALSEHTLHPVPHQYYFDFGSFNTNDNKELISTSHNGSFFDHHAIKVEDLRKNITAILMSNDGRKVTLYELSDYILNANLYSAGQIPASWWLTHQINQFGIDKALINYQIAIKQNNKLISQESTLNKLGYSYSASHLEYGVALMKLNTELYPKSANTYDSYAELLIKSEQYQTARQVIEQGLVIAKKEHNSALVMSLSNLMKSVPKL